MELFTFQTCSLEDNFPSGRPNWDAVLGGSCLFVEDAAPFVEIQTKVFYGCWDKNKVETEVRIFQKYIVSPKFAQDSLSVDINEGTEQRGANLCTCLPRNGWTRCLIWTSLAGAAQAICYLGLLCGFRRVKDAVADQIVLDFLGKYLAAACLACGCGSAWGLVCLLNHRSLGFGRSRSRTIYSIFLVDQHRHDVRQLMQHKTQICRYRRA